MIKQGSWFRLGRLFELQDPAHARLLPMEGLRGVAVTLVFLQHYGVQSESIGLHPGLAAGFARLMHGYGNFGVELFFVLSGYLIYGHLVRRSPSFLGFMGRRLQRIYPAFLIVFLMALAAMLLAPAPTRIPAEPWQATAFLFANVLLLPGLLPIARVVEVAWSLSYEMFFYLVTGAVVLGMGLSRATRVRRIALLMMVSAAFLAACFLAQRRDWAEFPLRMMPFFAGMLLAEGIGRRSPAWAGWAAPLAAFIVFAWHPPGPIAGAVFGEIIQTLGFFVLCAVSFRDAGRVSAFLIRAPLRWLGNMSYSYYLTHGFVVHAVMLVLGHLITGAMPDWLFWALIPPLYVATLGVSAVLFLLVEKPFSLAPPRPVAREVETSERVRATSG